MHALGLEFGSAARLSKRPGSVWNCLWGNALKRSPGIIRKSRVSHPGPGFLSSATWPSLPKKHYNGLNQTKPNKWNNALSSRIQARLCMDIKLDRSLTRLGITHIIIHTELLVAKMKSCIPRALSGGQYIFF